MTTTAVVPPTFDEYRVLHDLTADHPNLDGWRRLWGREIEQQTKAPQVIPSCPAWCTTPAGHDYDSVDGWGDELTFERQHVAFQGSIADVSAKEKNHFGTVTLDVAIIYVATDRDGERTAEQARALAVELLEAAAVLDRITQPASPVVLDDRGQVAVQDDYSPLNR